MSGLERLSDTALSGVAAGAIGANVPVFSSATGHFAPSATPSVGGPSYGFTPQNFSKWRAASMKVRDKTGFARTLTIGDSTSAGGGATGTNPAYLEAWPKKLQELLNSYYLPAVPGLQIYGENVADTRWTLGAGWSRATTGTAGLGGSSLQGAAGGAGSAVLTPGYMLDTIDFWYLDNGQGTVPVTIDTGETVNLVGSGSTGLKKTTLSVARASTHTISLACPPTNGFYLVAIEPYDSTIPAVRVGITGVSSSQTAGWVDNATAYRSLNVIGTYAPDLTIIQLGINDASASVSLATWQANIQTLITKAKLSGDVILVSVFPSSASGLASGAAGVALELAYANACITLAASNNCGYIDMNTRWVDYTTSNALGWYANLIHPNGFGYCDAAQAIFNALKTI